MIQRITVLMSIAAGFSLSADVRDEVSNAEKAVAAARASRDVPALDRLTADDFIWVRPNGAITGKKELLDGLTQGAGPDRLDLYDFDGEQRIRVYGDTAVVIGARILHEKSADRKIVVTDVWVKKKGRWQRVSSQTAYFSQGSNKK
jgi:ketosteroid isomerase-like protein